MFHKWCIGRREREERKREVLRNVSVLSTLASNQIDVIMAYLAHNRKKNEVTWIALTCLCLRGGTFMVA